MGIGRKEDISGRSFGKLTVIEPAGKDVRRQRLWKCSCECGSVHIVRTSRLSSGQVKSCGCLRHPDAATSYNVSAEEKYHGHSRSRFGRDASPTYSSWCSMLARCENPSNKSYGMYGARGVSVCEEWKDFRNFLRDMGERPDGTTLDRIDSHGNYVPGNCRWATATEQSRNRDYVRTIEYNGHTKLFIDWCRELGLNYSSTYQRIYCRGWSVEKAFDRQYRSESPTGRASKPSA